MSSEMTGRSDGPNLPNELLGNEAEFQTLRNPRMNGVRKDQKLCYAACRESG